MFKTLFAATTVSMLSLGAAQAATIIYATDAKIITEGPRGTANNRHVISNAFGNNPSTFFELGYNAVVDFYFGQSFQGPSGKVVEITNGNAENWLEAVRVDVGNTVGGVFTLLTTALPNPLLNTGNGIFTFSGGPFNTIRLTDVTCDIAGGKCDRDANGNITGTGGFDVASISVAAVPLPAGGLLLIGALGGLAVLRRRKARAA